MTRRIWNIIQVRVPVDNECTTTRTNLKIGPASEGAGEAGLSNEKGSREPLLLLAVESQTSHRGRRKSFFSFGLVGQSASLAACGSSFRDISVTTVTSELRSITRTTTSSSSTQAVSGECSKFHSFKHIGIRYY